MEDVAIVVIRGVIGIIGTAVIDDRRVIVERLACKGADGERCLFSCFRKACL